MQNTEAILIEIKKRFENNSLPGMNAMLQMAPPQREKLLKTHTQIPERASVLLLIYPKNGQLYFPLIIRSSGNLNDRHRGQIALPGGKRELDDVNDWYCAIRETNEELGIEREEIAYIGALSPNFIPISNFKVYPFVGTLKEKPDFNRQEDEVAAILEVPLQELLDPKNIKCGRIELASGMELENIPYFQLSEHKVWGATAMMLNEFVSLFEANPLP